MNDCPPQEQLEQLFAGSLSPAEESRLWRHVDECAACAEKEPESDDRYVKLVAHLKALDISGVEFDQVEEHDLDAGAVRRTRTQTDESSVTDQIAGYEIISEIHRGGQGAIFEAIQQSTNRHVAVKLLLAGRFASPEAERRFEREIEIVAGLKHPGIVAVYDSGRTRDGRQYCIMDLIDGRPLDVWIAENRPEPRNALELFAQICEAVHYAHQRGVIHRDLKPSNVVVEADGAPKVLDFGLARPAGSTEFLVSMTGQILGTLPYMSPEQTRGSPEDIDIRTDVYSLGIILYELLTGVYPYPVDVSLPDVLRHIKETTPQRPSRAWTAESGIFISTCADRSSRRHACPVDDDLETIVLKALSKEKDRRYQTALDLARDVRHYLENEPIEARRDSTLYVLRKTIHRHRGAAVIAVAFVLLLVSWGTAITVGYGKERELNRELQEKAQRTAVQRDRAIDAESRANRRFDQIREMAESFLFEFQDEIHNLPGSTPAREFVVSRALMYLGKLADESNDDPTLLRDLAMGYLKVGDVQGGLGHANLGDTQGAIQSFQKARQLAETWRQQAPDDPSAIRAAYEARIRLGDMRFVQASHDDALKEYEAASEIFEQLDQNSTADATFQRDLRKILTKIGDVHASKWRFDQADALYAESKAICERLIAQSPDNLYDRRDLAVVLLKQVRAAINVDQPPTDWAPKVDRSIELLQVAVKAEPDNATFLRDLAIASDFKAESRLKSEDLEGALTQYRESQSIAGRLLKIDPRNALARHDLMVSRNNVARALSELGRYDEALTEFRAGLAMAEALSAADPTNTELRREVGRSHQHVSITLFEMNDIKPAIQSAGAALEAFEFVASHESDNFGVQRDIAMILGLRGDLFLSIADDESKPVLQRTEAYENAAAEFLSFKRILLYLKDKNRLSEHELPVLDQLQLEVDRCRAAGAALIAENR